MEPTGTIIVDKLQRFLYFILPNNVAVRYGIALGEQCNSLVGLRHVASLAEWPPWQATPDMIKRKLASAGIVPGGPGNPLGARVLNLDDGASRINGTNAPKTIGNFWGHATTVFDFTRRAMPFNQPRQLTADEIYATTAYILFLNKIIGESDVMDAKTLPQVKMPNRDNFIIPFPGRI